MKIKKGIISNVNKKILTSSLALTLIVTSGCTTIKDINYKTNTQGCIYKIDGSISYDLLKKCYFAEVANNISDEKYYTIILKQFNILINITNHYNIFNGEKINKYLYKYSELCSVESFLKENGEAKKCYTEFELRKLLNEFLISKEKNKELVKE